MAKLNNEQKYEFYKERKILRIIIIVDYLLVVILSVISLIYKISFLYPLVLFIIGAVLTKYRETFDFKDKK